VVAERNGSAVIIETYTGAGDNAYFTNAVTEIVAGENAILKHYKRQLENENAFHVSTVQTRMDRNANCAAYSFDLGGRVVRNETNALLDGEGCEATVNGFYLLHNDQHVDNHTLIEHAKPNCSSHELYKGVLASKSQGIFRGKILVHQIAQKTDAYQQNQNLLLSDQAEANSKPQLEIYADDVKCSHGATIGQLDETAMFYMKSRGISPEHARQLLIQAFGGDVIDRVVVESLREDLHNRSIQKLSLQRKV
jgi:Fe-S cluster assembly protein SufD